jgi:hypothetical protein
MCQGVSPLYGALWGLGNGMLGAVRRGNGVSPIPRTIQMFSLYLNTSPETMVEQSMYSPAIIVSEMDWFTALQTVTSFSPCHMVACPGVYGAKDNHPNVTLAGLSAKCE